MRLDDHRIVIRERSYAELLDLSLHVLRNQAEPLAVALLAGIGPLVLLNAWLLDRFAAVPNGEGPPWTYLLLMLGLVLWESPLATAPATLCLGRALFNQPLEATQISRDFVQSLPQLILYQVLWRGLLLATVAAGFVPFVVHPYLNEIILLERNPLHAAGKRSLSTSRRSSRLHQGNGGDFFLRWILNTLIGPILIVAIWGTLAVAARWLLAERVWTQPFYTCLYPVAIWLVVAYFAVVRFLAYLDLRIRSEGWEVELLMRAELDRWTRMPQAS